MRDSCQHHEYIDSREALLVAIIAEEEVSANYFIHDRHIF